MSVVNEAPWWQNSHITRTSHEPSPRFSSLLWMLTDVLCSNIPASSQVAPIAPVDPSCHIQSYISRHHNGKKNCKIMCGWALPINTTRSLTGSNSWFFMPYLLTTSAKLCIAKKKKLWPPPPPQWGYWKLNYFSESTHLNHSIQLEKLQVQLFKILLKNLSQPIVTHYLHKQCKGLLLWKLQM